MVDKSHLVDEGNSICGIYVMPTTRFPSFFVPTPSVRNTMVCRRAGAQGT
jgi:hypothetical protein